MPVFMCVGMGVGMDVAVGGQRIRGVRRKHKHTQEGRGQRGRDSQT